MATATPITTAEAEALARLLAWLSPAYPTGGFAYSHGLEAAVEEGAVRGRDELIGYAGTVLAQGGASVDAGLLVLAGRAAAAGDAAELDAVSRLASAWRGSAELALEAAQPGAAFAATTRAAWPHAGFAAFLARHEGRVSHAVAVGAAAGFQGLPMAWACFGWLSAFVANLVSAGVRLIPLGQTDGQIATARLLPAVRRAAERALAVRDAGELGSAAPWIDLCSMRHETQYTRLFRS